MASCLETFERHGESLQVAANRPLVLDDATSVWLVQTGRIEVFATPAGDGAAAASRSYLGRVEPGQALFGCPGDGTDALCLLAVGLPGTKVFKLPIARLQEMAAAPETADQVCALVNRWIEQLTSEVAQDAMPRITSALEAGRDTPVAAGAVVSPARTVWVSAPETPCRFLGRASVSLGRDGDVFPRWPARVGSRRRRKRLSTPTKREACSTAHVCGRDCSSSTARSWLAPWRTSRRRLTKNGLASTERPRQKSLRRLPRCRNSQRPFIRNTPAKRQFRWDKDPLLAACQLIGGYLKNRHSYPQQLRRNSTSRSGERHCPLVRRADPPCRALRKMVAPGQRPVARIPARGQPPRRAATTARWL